MCGILFILSYDSGEKKAIEDSILPLLHHRGPDGYHKYTTTITSRTNDVATVEFHGAVLHLRGGLTKQPLVSDDGHVFMWNGEIFGGDVQITEDANDTMILFEKLCMIPFAKEDHHLHLLSLFETIQGPWAFVFYDALNKNIWYGRDYFGRRSLMSSCTENTFSLSSLGHRMFADRFSEVPAKVLYCLNIERPSTGDITKSLKTYGMQLSNENICKQLVEHRCVNEYITNTNHLIPELSEKNTLNSTENHIELNTNGINTEKKCCNCLTVKDTTVPYLNGNQESGSPKCLKSKDITEIKQSTSSCKICSVPFDNSNDTKSLKNVQDEFLCILEDAVCKRVYNLPRGHYDSNEDASMSSKVGILFSGGIDSVVLTSLADRCIPPYESIDLINVAFAQKQKVQQNVKKKDQKPMNSNIMNFNVPDRITGRTALKELSKKRRWNFIEVDVTLEELQEARMSTITNLVYPLDSVLDDSIGCAIWFAARGVGRCYNLHDDDTLHITQENYKSPVKVLLTGMGADEQLGGYARHRTKFESFGWSGLEEEMKMELERISSRNLGRDDRCISDHGREARFPFLDENVVSFLQRIPVCVKCDPRLPRGCGEKVLLREVATSLGLQYASKLPKRAIQFGSKIAKLESSREKGSDNCKRLENVQIS